MSEPTAVFLAFVVAGAYAATLLFIDSQLKRRWERQHIANLRAEREADKVKTLTPEEAVKLVADVERLRAEVNGIQNLAAFGRIQ